jgi:hypothetical protein
MYGGLIVSRPASARVGTMSAKIVGDKLVIEMPIHERSSKSGKSILIATTGGAVKDACKYNGKPVEVSVNAYYRP